MCNPLSQQFKKAIAQNPINIERNNTKILDLVRFYNNIYTAEFYRAMVLTQEFCEISAVVVPGLVRHGGSFMFRKDDPIVETVSEITRKSLEYIRYILMKYEKFLLSNCEDKINQEQGLILKAVNFGSLSGSFLLLVAGVIVGLSILIYEILWKSGANDTVLNHVLSKVETFL